MTQIDQTKKTVKITKPSYLYAIVSITLVLFMLGLLGVILLEANKLSSYFKENIVVTLILSDKIEAGELDSLTTQLSKQVYLKKMEYTSKEDAVKKFAQQTHEDVADILGYNPLFASIDLNLNAKYTHPDSLRNIKKSFATTRIVKEVFYQDSLVEVIDSNTNKISFFLLILSVIFTLIAFALIDNTVKLAMYSNRFLIKSMQLVGATRWFIAGPFITQSFYNGITSGLLASVLLASLLIFAQQNIPELGVLHEAGKFVLLCIVVILAGIAISWWSPRRSVVKYLQTQLDELY